MNTLPDEMEDLRESRTLSEWLIEWLESRNWLRLLAGVPALLAAIGVVVFAVFYFGWTPAHAAASCLEAGNRAFSNRDYDRARVAFMGLTRLQGRTQPEYAYKIALSLAQRGRKEEAVALLAAIAPPDRAGYAPAHLFLARALLETGNTTPRLLRGAESHLQKVLTQDTKNDDARLLLGQIYARFGQWEDVRKQLTEVVSAKPEAALLLATAHRALGDDSAARTWAARAAKHFGDLVEQTAGNVPSERMAWAEALVMLQDYEQAFTLMEAGYRKSSDPGYRSALGQLCAAWSDNLGREKPLEIAERLRLVQQGLRYAPANRSLLRTLAALSSLQGAAGDAARTAVNQTLAAGENVALLHFCLGGLAWERGDLETARFHFGAAYAGAPEMPDIANNLASVLADGEKPDLPRALAVIQPLIDRFPDHPYYRDTRGHVLLKLGRQREAIQDLEFSLPQLEDPRPTHAALARAYRQLGINDLAEEHEKRAALSLSRPPGKK
jgi:tetratricopeptide (TPR) repeat protein